MLRVLALEMSFEEDSARILLSDPHVKTRFKLESQYLNCETKTSLFSWQTSLANFYPDFSQFCADLFRFLADFSWFLAKETPKFFDIIKAGDFTINKLAKLGNEKSAQSVAGRSFSAPPSVMDVCAFGSYMSPPPECWFFSRGSRAWPKVLALDVRTNDSGTSAGYPARKLSLRAVCSFLKNALHRSHLGTASGGPTERSPCQEWFQPNLGNARLFTNYCSQHFCANYPPPLPTNKVMDFLLNFYKKGPQTELRTKVRKSAETILPFSCCPLVFLWEIPKNREKRVSESKNPHIPPPQKRVFRVKKSPFSLKCSVYRNGELFD